MIDVVLLDDEPLIRIGLKSIIDWEANGFRIVGEGSNGREGLQLIESLKPALVFVDIKMPILDGLQVIEQCGGKCKFVVLTAYNDYPYIRKALQLGALDYFVKPELQESELLNVLERVKSGLSVPASKPAATGLSVEEFVSKAILDEITLEPGSAPKLIETPVKNFFLILLQVKDSGALSRYDADELKTLDVFIVNIFKELQSHDFETYAFKQKTGMYCGFCLFDNTEVDSSLKSKIKRSSVRLTEMLCQYCNIEFVCAVSGFHNSVSEIKKAFLECVSCLEKIYMHKKNEAFFYENERSFAHNKNVLCALEYIQANYAEKIGLFETAVAIKVNPSYLSTVFKKEMGKGINDYINSLKIDKAIELLTNSNIKVYEVSNLLHFDSPFYFSKVFKRKTGLSPVEYIKRHSPGRG